MAVSGLVKGLVWQESVVYWWMAWPDILSVDCATYQPLRSQHSPVMSCLIYNHGLPPF